MGLGANRMRFVSTPDNQITVLTPSEGRALRITNFSYSGASPDGERRKFMLWLGSVIIAYQSPCTRFDGSSPGPFIGDADDAVRIDIGVEYSTVIFDYEEI